MAKKRTGQGALFCVICGEAALKDESVCPGCGSHYEGEARFCGQNPYGAGGIGYSDRAKDKTFRRNNRKTLVGTLIAMLVISALIAGFLLLSGQLTADAVPFPRGFPAFPQLVQQLVFAARVHALPEALVAVEIGRAHV